MALEELSTTVSKLTFNFFGSESEKKVGGFLFNEKTEWASSRELHGLAALTFNDRECAGVMAVLVKALEPKENTWRTLHKAVKLLHHFVLYGAERCVDHAWDHQRRVFLVLYPETLVGIVFDPDYETLYDAMDVVTSTATLVEELQRYNSAIHGRTSTLTGGGTDFGAPVRKAAEELSDLLKDSGAIRAAREEGRTPDALLPIGAADDYSAPVAAREIDIGLDDAFGIVPEGSIGARFDLQQVPGLYEGRPDRYFDNSADPRRRTQGVEDSDHTRQALAADLLDLDIGEAQPARVPESQDLVRAGKEAALQRQLQAQQQQLEQLKTMMLSKAQPGGAGVVNGGSNGVLGGGGATGGGGGGEGGTNMSAMGGAKTNNVMEAFGSMGLGEAGRGRGELHPQGLAGAMGSSMHQGGGVGVGVGGTTLGGGGLGANGGGGGLGLLGNINVTAAGGRGGLIPPSGEARHLGGVAGGAAFGQGGLGNLGMMGNEKQRFPPQGQQLQQQQQLQLQLQRQQLLQQQQQQLFQQQRLSQVSNGGMGMPGGMGGSGMQQNGKMMMGGSGMGQLGVQGGLNMQQQQQKQQQQQQHQQFQGLG